MNFLGVSPCPRRTAFAWGASLWLSSGSQRCDAAAEFHCEGNKAVPGSLVILAPSTQFPGKPTFPPLPFTIQHITIRPSPMLSDNENPPPSLLSGPSDPPRWRSSISQALCFLSSAGDELLCPSFSARSQGSCVGLFHEAPSPSLAIRELFIDKF